MIQNQIQDTNKEILEEITNQEQPKTDLENITQENVNKEEIVENQTNTTKIDNITLDNGDKYVASQNGFNVTLTLSGTTNIRLIDKKRIFIQQYKYPFIICWSF